MLQQAGGSLGVDVDDSGEQDGRVQQVHEGAVVAALPAVRAEVVLEVGPLGAPVRENPFGHEGHDGEDDEGHHGEPRHHRKRESIRTSMPAMDTTRARVETEVGLSFLSLAPHIDSSFVLYPTRKRRPSSNFVSISSLSQRERKSSQPTSSDN